MEHITLQTPERKIPKKKSYYSTKNIYKEAINQNLFHLRCVMTASTSNGEYKWYLGTTIAISTLFNEDSDINIKNLDN